MDSTLLGETLRVENGSPQTYKGMWMPAGGNDGVGAVEVFVCSSADAFEVQMQTKSSDEADPATGVAIIGSVAISAAGAAHYRFPVASAKDLVRYMIEGLGETDTAYMHFQLVRPTWAPN